MNLPRRWTATVVRLLWMCCSAPLRRSTALSSLSVTIAVCRISSPAVWTSARLTALRERKAYADQACSSQSVESPRSEEHTSELQSRENLVCRLLLEKEKEGRAALHPGRRTSA